MRYRRLGQWGAKLSVVSFGTWLTHGGSVDEQDTVHCVHRAYDAGINFFDTANEYQAGRAEEALGKALSGLDRETYLVGTKVYMPMGEGPLRRGLSRKHVMSQIDGSLRRLGVDFVDLYQCHRYDPEVPVEEVARTMDDLVRAGKVLYWGVSEWPPDKLVEVIELCRAAGWAVPVSDQVQYSALWRTIEPEVLPACRRTGTGVLAWSPLAMGLLTGKYAPGAVPEGSRRASGDGWFLDRYLRPGVLEAVQEFKKIAENAGYTAAQLAIAWCLHDEAMTSAIVGASRPDQLSENLAKVDEPLDPALHAEVASLLEPVARL
ncbi:MULTISPECIES: aldo/keto reductase family protein [Amycolatopsis]|uniref:Predicted oxidoreductase n=2 Tax=Amycolatopsis TaxID=1813 RepID=A0A1I3UZY7_9PSEU|nr:aldo/keto reductase family protein [Amycolatopsis sacchari]SFJ88452.1 Predicted oxidoreductase [Amycolatopsis sacchari]